MAKIPDYILDSKERYYTDPEFNLEHVVSVGLINEKTGREYIFNLKRHIDNVSLSPLQQTIQFNKKHPEDVHWTANTYVDRAEIRISRNKNIKMYKLAVLTNILEIPHDKHAVQHHKEEKNGLLLDWDQFISEMRDQRMLFSKMRVYTSENRYTEIGFYESSIYGHDFTNLMSYTYDPDIGVDERSDDGILTLSWNADRINMYPESDAFMKNFPEDTPRI